MVLSSPGDPTAPSTVAPPRNSSSIGGCLSSCALIALVCLFLIQLATLLYLSRSGSPQDIANGAETVATNSTKADVAYAGQAIVLDPGQECTVAVASGQREIGTAGGVKIDLGRYNDLANTTATISRKNDDTTGLLGNDATGTAGGMRSVYDIKVAGHTSFDDPIAITLPYDPQNTDPQNEVGSVIAEYKNPQSGQWELIPFRVNTQAHSVTIITDHLSEYCVATFKDANTPYARIASLESCYLDDKVAADVLSEFSRNNKPGPTTASVNKQVWASLLLLTTFPIAAPPGSAAAQETQQDPEILREYTKQLVEVSEEYYSLVNDVVGWLGDVGATTYDSFDPLAKLGNKVSDFTMNLSIASLCYSYINIFTGQTTEQEFRNTLSSTAESYIFSKTAWGALKVANIAVIAVKYSLDKFQAEADKQYKEGVYRAMIAYNEEMYPQSEAEWYKQLRKIYDHTKGRPNSAARFDAAVNYLLTARGQRFFDASYDEQSTAHRYAGVKFLTSAEPYHLNSAKDYCIAQYRARLGIQLQPVFERLCERIAYEADQERDKSLNAMKDYLNAPLRFVVEEQVPHGKKPRFGKGSMVVLRSRNGQKSGHFRLNLDANGCAKFDCTVLGYIQNGLPQVMEVYKSSVSDKPSYTTEFQVKGKTTRLVIPSSGDAADILPATPIEDELASTPAASEPQTTEPFTQKLLLVPEQMRDFNVGEHFGPLISLNSYTHERIAFAKKEIAKKNAGRKKPLARTASSVKSYYELIDDMSNPSRVNELCGATYTLDVRGNGQARLRTGSQGRHYPDSGFYGKECTGGTYDSGSRVFRGEGSCWNLPRGGLTHIPAAVIMGQIEIDLRSGKAKWDTRTFKVYPLNK